MSEILYERKYPREAEETPFEAVPERPLPSFTEFCQNIGKDRTIILLPERALLADGFVRLAIKTGEACEIDTKVIKADSHISVYYQFDCGGEMDGLIPIFQFADSVSFFTGIGPFDITVVLDYYTHAVYRGDQRIYPRRLIG